MVTALVALLLLGGIVTLARALLPLRPFGLSQRELPRAYLNMPQTADGKMPQLLSQTGVFSDTRHLIVERRAHSV